MHEVKYPVGIRVITPVYNAEKYIEKCIVSVANQMYCDYEMVIIDDCSTDGTLEIVKKTLKRLSGEIRWRYSVVSNTERKGALNNQIASLESIGDDTVVVLLDGDDWLTDDPMIFSYLSEQYSDGHDMTYGSCHSICDDIDLIAQEYPPDVIKDKSYRTHLFAWGMPYTHLRTFKASLSRDLQGLKDENGEYWKEGGDGALFYGVIERAKSPKAIQRVIVQYNDANPINDYKVNGQSQTQNAKTIRAFVNNVLDRKPEAVVEYKQRATHRNHVWIDVMQAETIKPRRDWLVSEIEKERQDVKILDIGSWTGALANEMYATGHHEITCMDITVECVEMGQSYFPYMTWIRADVEDYETTEKYDIITMMEVIEHLIEPQKTLEKIKKWLTPTGRILITIPTRETVEGDGRNIAEEHISLLTQQQVQAMGFATTVLDSDCYFQWYVGEYRRKTEVKVLIGIPTASNIDGQTYLSIYKMDKPDGTDLQLFYGYDVAQVRNLMADYAIRNNYTHILFVDSDIVLPTNALTQLLSHAAPIVSGVYRQRWEDRVVIEGGKGTRKIEMSDMVGTQEVTYCGFGCVLVETELLRKIGYPQFEYHHTLDFAQTVSEDADFCRKATALGIPVLMDTDIRCGHRGTFTLELDDRR